MDGAILSYSYSTEDRCCLLTLLTTTYHHTTAYLTCLVSLPLRIGSAHAGLVSSRLAPSARLRLSPLCVSHLLASARARLPSPLDASARSARPHSISLAFDPDPDAACTGGESPLALSCLVAARTGKLRSVNRPNPSSTSPSPRPRLPAPSPSPTWSALLLLSCYCGLPYYNTSLLIERIPAELWAPAGSDSCHCCWPISNLPAEPPLSPKSPIDVPIQVQPPPHPPSRLLNPRFPGIRLLSIIPRAVPAGPRKRAIHRPSLPVPHWASRPRWLSVSLRSPRASSLFFYSCLSQPALHPRPPRSRSPLIRVLP